MSVAQFAEKRRQMIAAVRMIAEHLVAETGKTALDDRVLTAMTTSAAARVRATRGPAIRLPE